MMALEPKSHKSRVLVIRLSSLGDVVLASSVVAPLTAAGFEVCLLTKKAFAPLWEGLPGVEVRAFDKSQGEARARAEFFSWFHTQNFSFVLDLQDSWRTRFWRRKMEKQTEVLVARKERLREWLILYGRLGPQFSFGRGGRAKKFRRLALDVLVKRGILLPHESSLTALAVTEKEKLEVKQWLPEKDFALLLPGSAWKGKEWPYFPELAVVLAKKVPVVILGAEKDKICDEAASLSGGISLRGKTSLRQSMAVIAQARWVIGNDTGMVHVGEALGKDVAMVEGPTHEQMGFSPYREKSVLLGLPLWCRPCSKSGQVCVRWGSRKCLRDLSVSMVAQKLKMLGFPC